MIVFPGVAFAGERAVLIVFDARTVLEPKKTLKGGQKGPFLEDFRKFSRMVVLNQIIVHYSCIV